MSPPSPPPPPPKPPQQAPISNCHSNLCKHLPKPTSLPDLFFTALSLLFLFPSSPKPQTLFSKISSLSFPQNPRRFLKTPTMISPSNPKPITQFSSPQSLTDWLKHRLPSDSFASWGVKPGTKNVHNLWLELSEGETSLADSIPPIRTVRVVTVRIISEDNRILLESHQELSDGTIRERCRPLSEKMKPGETLECAVHRAVKEELGSIIQGNGNVRIVPGSYEQKVEERVSASYPGLPACYVLHSVNAWVDGLPDGEFCTEEEEYRDWNGMGIAEMAVSVKRHYWKWVDFDSV
ncbi:hypothetical protein VitviT2T_025478 [Vitis vinifera]|uniref:Uncharacterized protein n=3 Tax=Vitis vinifera TaxID=29760 RepID=F6H773_VITVI|nr:uncharacterized protein LOC100854009 [Vitis vinifera]WKA07689.1 hypothetical protein VitviT2T_025478 [Vitis vinifera]|eukprot:XP_010662935.1 PREDICTED: uncharacterized protein LOC100854009 [Vitis vinifera]